VGKVEAMCWDCEGSGKCAREELRKKTVSVSVCLCLCIHDRIVYSTHTPYEQISMKALSKCVELKFAQ
jgi:hypothetical protein